MQTYSDSERQSAYCNLLFNIVPNGHESLLGDKASEALGLVKKIYQINADNMKRIKQGKRLDHKQSLREVQT